MSSVMPTSIVRFDRLGVARDAPGLLLLLTGPAFFAARASLIVSDGDGAPTQAVPADQCFARFACIS